MSGHVSRASEPPKHFRHRQHLESWCHVTTQTQFNSHKAFEQVLSLSSPACLESLSCLASPPMLASSKETLSSLSSLSKLSEGWDDEKHAHAMASMYGFHI
jgi:hypothetical protein